MAEVARLEGAISISGADAAQRALKDIHAAGQQAAASLSHLSEQAVGGFARMSSAGGALGGVLQTAIGTALGFAVVTPVMNAVSAGVGFLGEAMVGMNQRLEQARIGFGTMLGSAQQAEGFLQKLGQFAASTPFEFKELIPAAQRLMAMGFSAGQVIPVLTSVGDAVAAVGGTSATLDRVTLALGQMQARGKVATQEMNQLTEAGIPSWQILSEKMGVATGKLQEMVEKGAVPAGKAIEMLTQGMNERFGGMMEKTSHTFMGAMSNIKDSVNIVASTAFSPLFQVLTNLANRLAEFTQSDDFREWAARIQGALTPLADGLNRLIASWGNWSEVGKQASGIADMILAGLLTLGAKMLPVVASAIEGLAGFFASAAGSAVVWGFNLTVSIGQGMVEGAAAAISAAAEAIGQMIAGFFEGASPPKKGKLSEIDTWGATLMRTYLNAMVNSDFSILDQIGQTIKDVLTTQMQAGAFGEEGLIPRLLGGKGAVMAALSDLREFGQVSEQTVANLTRSVGGAADSILELIGTFNQLSSIQSRIKDIEGDMRDAEAATRAWNVENRRIQGEMRDADTAIRNVKRAHEETLAPLQKELDLVERRYKAEIDGADQALRRVSALIRIREGELGGGRNPALEQEEARLRVSDAQLDLEEAQNAAGERAARIRAQIAEKDRDIARARSQQTDSRGAERINDLLQDRAKLEAQLAKEGVETDRDRLAIAQARHGLMEAEVALRKALDPNLQALYTERDTLAQSKQNLEDRYDLESGPLKAAIDAENDAYKDQLKPLEDARDAVRNRKEDHDAVKATIDDTVASLQDEKAALEAQAEPLQAAIKLAQDRWSIEADVATQLERQASLLASLEDAATGAAKKAGAGAAAAARGGLSGPKLDVDFTKDMKAIQIPKITLDLEEAKKGFQEQFEKTINEAFEKAIASPKTWMVGTAALAGGVVFGPVGAAIAAALMLGITKAIEEDQNKQFGQSMIKRMRAELDEEGPAGLAGLLYEWWSKGTLEFFRRVQESVGDFAGKLFGPIFRAIKEKLVGGGDNESVFGTGEGSEGFSSTLRDFLFDEEKFKAIGHDLVMGIWDGMKATWEDFKNELKGSWENVLNFFKDLLGISSPSTVMKDEIGIPLVEGIITGVTEKWEDFKAWLGERPGKILEHIGDVTGTLVQKGIDLLTGLSSGSVSVWTDTIQPWLAGRAGAVVGAIGELAGTLTQKGRDLLTGLQTGASEVWGTVTAWFSGLADLAVAAVGNVSQKLVQKGRDMIQGFIDGIVSMTGPVGTAVGNLIGGVLQRFENMGRSPWPSTIEHGSDFGEGFYEGILAWLGPVGDAAVQLVMAALVPLQQGAGLVQQSIGGLLSGGMSGVGAIGGSTNPITGSGTMIAPGALLNKVQDAGGTVTSVSVTDALLAAHGGNLHSVLQDLVNTGKLSPSEIGGPGNLGGLQGPPNWATEMLNAQRAQADADRRTAEMNRQTAEMNQQAATTIDAAGTGMVGAAGTMQSGAGLVNEGGETIDAAGTGMVGSTETFDQSVDQFSGAVDAIETPDRIAGTPRQQGISEGTIQAASGGFASGPKSGYPAILHGDELIIPRDDPTRAYELATRAGLTEPLTVSGSGCGGTTIIIDLSGAQINGLETFEVRDKIRRIVEEAADPGKGGLKYLTSA